ncbi:MAG: sigma-70 family RNA polymerase sigma factor, partial [Vicinamibacterales bacterium]|nr:sigma-70 family RNA polymerase sigma factor [Vicinamibacterales bacterium]
ARLLTSFREGDPNALRLLLRKCLSFLTGWASGRLPRSVRSAIDTSDVIQDTMAATFPKLEHFESRGPGSLQSYLRKVFRNRVRDEIRRAHRRPRPADVDAGQLASPDRSPLDGLLDRETSERVLAALGALDERDQIAVIGRYEMGYSYEQLAVILGKTTPDAARKFVARAIERLAREMARVDEADQD